jgi:glucose-6-phosphate isomerase
MVQKIWDQLKEHNVQHLAQLFAQQPSRVEAMTIRQSDILFDFSKTHLDDGLIDLFSDLAQKAGLSAAQEALFTGKIVNPTEGRAAIHTAERGNGSADSVAEAKGFHARMRGLI